MALQVSTKNTPPPDHYSLRTTSLDKKTQDLFTSSRRSSSDEELMTRRGRSRTCYPFTSNMTIARMNEIIHNSGIGPFDPNFDPIKKMVMDHAYRRVQIFYYQLLFYYKEGCDVYIARTSHQHGKSSCGCCDACHSAILPNLSDAKNLLNDNHQLYHTMNSTVELPRMVNLYDNAIEYKMRSVALEIINATSKEKIHPYKALQIFVDRMQIFFQNSSAEIKEKIELIMRITNLEHRIKFLEQTETRLPKSWVTQYIEAISLIRDLEKQYCSKNNYSNNFYFEKYPEERIELFQFVLSGSHAVTTESDIEIFYNQVRAKISQILPIQLEPLSQTLLRNQEAYEICQFQILGTTLPDYPFLSGKFENGKRVGYKEEELLEQKLEIQQIKIRI